MRGAQGTGAEACQVGAILFTEPGDAGNACLGSEDVVGEDGWLRAMIVGELFHIADVSFYLLAPLIPSYTIAGDIRLCCSGDFCQCIVWRRNA